MTAAWVSSRFNARKTVEGSLILYNSFTGGLLLYPPGPEQAAVRQALAQGFEGTPAGALADLVEAGMLVPAAVDERQRALYVAEVEAHPGDELLLTVLPTEQCNFRCRYCYEEFARGTMDPAVRAGLKALVEQRARRLSLVGVSWFGGEPLLAPDVLEELSESFMASCARFDTHYMAGITTNGSLLTPDLVQKLFRWQIRSFQITLDGPAETHDQRRIGADGAGTFARVWSGIEALAATDEPFRALIRINFDTEVLAKVPDLLETLSRRLAGDQRFSLWPVPVGDWGGPHTGTIETCGGEQAWVLMEQGMRRGLGAARGLQSHLRPHGSVCYAAKSHASVVGADGTIYKCTVALDDERNRVGRLLPDGRLDLDMDKVGLWVNGNGETEAKCGACFFQPACQGKSCPLARIRTGHAPCPKIKDEIGKALRIIALENAGD